MRGVDPASATRWWSDFQEGRADHAFLPGHRRRIVERAADRIVMEEQTKLLGIRVFHERTTAWPGAREVRFAGRNNFALFDGAYSFHPHANGTKVVLDANVTLRKPIAWTDVAARPVVIGILKADLAAHAREMERDLAKR